MQQNTVDEINTYLGEQADIVQEYADEVDRLQALYDKEVGRNLPVIFENRRLKNELHALQQRNEFLEAALTNLATNVAQSK